MLVCKILILRIYTMLFVCSILFIWHHGFLQLGRVVKGQLRKQYIIISGNATMYHEPLLLGNCPILIYFFKFEITAWLWPCLMHLSVFDVTFIHMHLLKFIGFSHNSVYFFFSSLKSFIHVHLKIRTKFKSNSYTTIKSHSYKCTSFLTQLLK